MKTVTFTVGIGGTNDIDVDVEVTEEEYQTMQRYISGNENESWDKEYVDFCDCEELAPLYQKVLDAAYDAMAESITDDDDFIEMYCDGDSDFDVVRDALTEKYEVYTDWPTLEP